MRTLRHIVELALITRPVWENTVSHRTMPRIVSLLVLSVIAGLLACTLMAGIFYAIYRGGIAYGFTPDGALLVTGACVLAAFVAVLATIRCILCKMRVGSLPRMSRLADITEAFLEGLNGPNHRS